MSDTFFSEKIETATLTACATPGLKIGGRTSREYRRALRRRAQNEQRKAAVATPTRKGF